MAYVKGTMPPKQSTPALQTFAPKSSFMALLEYDQANLTLTTHMLNGAIYQHKFVTPIEFTSLQTAQNHGKFWATNIKGKKLSVRIKHVKSPKANLKHPRRNP